MQAHALRVAPAISIPLPEGLGCNGLLIVKFDEQEGVARLAHHVNGLAGEAVGIGIASLQIGRQSGIEEGIAPVGRCRHTRTGRQEKEE